jgi:hypothetical protein
MENLVQGPSPSICILGPETRGWTNPWDSLAPLANPAHLVNFRPVRDLVQRDEVDSPCSSQRMTPRANLWPPLTHTHTHTHTHKHIICTHIHTHSHTYIHKYMHTYMHIHTQARIHAHIHTHIHAHTCMHTHIYIHTYIHRARDGGPTYQNFKKECRCCPGGCHWVLGLGEAETPDCKEAVAHISPGSM